MHEGVILSGANFIPQGNDLSNRIREKDKGKRSWQTTNFRGASEPIKSEKRIMSNPSNQVLYCLGSSRSHSLSQSSLSFVSDRFASRLQSSKVLCRKISLLVLSARVAKCCVGSSCW